MVVEFEIDLREVNSYVEGEDELSKITKELKKQKLFGKKFLYTGFEGLKIPELQKGINYRNENSIFAFCSENFRWNSDLEKRGLVDYCDCRIVPAIAIWDARGFVQDYECQRYECRFKEDRDVSNSLKGLARLI